MPLNLHLEANSAQELLAMLHDLIAATITAAGVQGLPVSHVPNSDTAVLALFTTEELLAQVALRTQQETATMPGVAGAQDTTLPLPGIEPAPAPVAAAPKRRGRPPKAAPEPAPVQPNGHDTTGESEPDPAAIAADPTLTGTGLGEVAFDMPDRSEMERLISALFSRGKTMDQVRELIAQETGAPTLGKAKPETWPRLRDAALQELKNMAARVS